MADYEEIMEYRNQHNQFAAFLGIRTTEIGQGKARGEMEIRPDMVNPINSVHGGCIFSLADTIGGAAAASYGTKMTTISSDMHYLLPAMDVKKLYAEANIIKHGKKICVCDVGIYDSNRTLIAKGTFSYYNLGMPLIN